MPSAFFPGPFPNTHRYPGNQVRTFQETDQCQYVVHVGRPRKKDSTWSKYASPYCRNFWLSKEARDAKKHRRRLERRWKRTGAEDTRVEYRESCRLTNRLITDSRKKYFSDKISQSDGSRGRWSVVKNLLHSNGLKRILRTPDEARLFCVSVAQFFHNKVLDIKSSIASRLLNTTGDSFLGINHTMEPCWTI